MKTILVNGTILSPDEHITSAVIVVDGKQISQITSLGQVGDTDQVIDAKGMYIIPGLIDLHVHGGFGVDTMDGTVEAIDSLSTFEASHGVTSFLPTTVAASQQDTIRAIRAVEEIRSSEIGSNILGIHLEGPYLEHEFRGAQPEQHLRKPDFDEYTLWLSHRSVKLVTLAPELPGSADFIRAGIQRDVRFSAGHTNATFSQALDAIDLGLNQVTHLFNGMHPLHHRNPGVVGAALVDDRLFAQVIADGIHIHPSVLKLIVKTKGIDRTILISDAIRATGLPDGEYTLGDQKVFVHEGIARTKSGGLAGSTLTMEKALQNMIRFSGCGLSEVLQMCTSVPAAAMGLKTKGRIAEGYDADLVVLDRNYLVQLTMVAGKIVYERTNSIS